MDVAALSELISERHHYLLLHRCCFCVAATEGSTNKHRQLISLHKYSSVISSRWSRMTLNGVMTLILHYFTEFSSFRSALHKSVHVRRLVKKFTFAISSRDELLVTRSQGRATAHYDRDFIPQWRCCLTETSSAYNYGKVNILWMKGTGRSIRS